MLFQRWDKTPQSLVQAHNMFYGPPFRDPLLLLLTCLMALSGHGNLSHPQTVCNLRHCRSLPARLRVQRQRIRSDSKWEGDTDTYGRWK